MKYGFLALFLAHVGLNFGMQEVKHRTVQGEVYALPHITCKIKLAKGPWCYVGCYPHDFVAKIVHILDSNKKSITIAGNDVWVPVITPAELDLTLTPWNHYYEVSAIRDNLPEALPLSLLLNGKSVIMKNGGEFVEITLACDAPELKQRMGEFAKRPNFMVSDAKALLTAGVIIKNPEYTRDILKKFLHGPHSFLSLVCDEKELKEQANEQHAVTYEFSNQENEKSEMILPHLSRIWEELGQGMQQEIKKYTIMVIAFALGLYAFKN